MRNAFSFIYRPIVGATAAMIFSYIWLFNLELPDPATIHSYGIGVVCFSISAIIEMMSEPIYIVAQKLFYVRFKVKSIITRD